MRKKIILFFLTMMILTDDPRLSVQTREKQPIVDTYGRIFGFDDSSVLRNHRLLPDVFLLDVPRYHIRILDGDVNLTLMSLDVFSHSGPAGFSKIIKHVLPLN